VAGCGGGSGDRDVGQITQTVQAALAGSRLSLATRAGLLHAPVTHVTVRGAAATVAASDIRATTGSLAAFLAGNGPTTLRRQRDGTWRISG
jgi:hypothetical protein